MAVLQAAVPRRSAPASILVAAGLAIGALLDSTVASPLIAWAPAAILVLFMVRGDLAASAPVAFVVLVILDGVLAARPIAAVLAESTAAVLGVAAAVWVLRRRQRTLQPGSTAEVAWFALLFAGGASTLIGLTAAAFHGTEVGTLHGLSAAVAITSWVPVSVAVFRGRMVSTERPSAMLIGGVVVLTALASVTLAGRTLELFPVGIPAMVVLVVPALIGALVLGRLTTYAICAAGTLGATVGVQLQPVDASTITALQVTLLLVVVATSCLASWRERERESETASTGPAAGTHALVDAGDLTVAHIVTLDEPDGTPAPADSGA